MGGLLESSTDDSQDGKPIVTVQDSEKGASPQLLLRVEVLTKRFPVPTGLFSRTRSSIHAVEDISFDLTPGDSLGLVGESGCGKTTTARLLVKLIEPSGGQIFFRDDHNGFTDIAHIKGRELKAFRRKAQMIFQDPYESMNPRRTIFDTVNEPLSVQNIGGPMERRERVTKMLESVGLVPAPTFLFRYPHELSGGQRQRVAIARALVVEPSFVVADEPTSMLDVSMRIGIMNLMRDLARRLDITYLYITHDLAVARYMCDRVAVMYLGKIVEMAQTEELLKNPVHPYTKALLSAVPVPDPTFVRQAVDIEGGVTRPIDPPARCRFYDRCLIAAAICCTSPHPPLEDKGAGHSVACYRV